jgi:hypothetical protein
MSQFPIVLMPAEIERIQRELPPIPTFTDCPPAYPRLEPQPPTFVRTLIEAVLFSICASLIYPISKIAGIILFIIGLGILSIYQFQRVKTYRKQLHSYNLVLEAYYKSLDIYARKEAQHETNVALAHSTAKLLEYRRPKLLEFLGGAIARGITTNSITQSEVVRNFAQILSDYFPDLIHMGWQVELSNGIFTPDIAYIDPATNLRMAIEVDEIRGGTHPLENRNSLPDREYNQNLMDARWIVVRFSETQVIQSPQSCCKAIATLLDRLWGLPQLMHRFADVPDLAMKSQ